MLTSFSLGNFKAFRDTQLVPVKPLTLLFGPNSSGKSSLIHGLLLAHHIIETGDIDVHRPLLGGDSVDLGGFIGYYHQDSEWGRYNMESGTTISVSLPVAQMEDSLAEKLTSVEHVTIALDLEMKSDIVDTKTHVVSRYSIKADDALLVDMRLSQDSTRFDIKEIAQDHPMFDPIVRFLAEPMPDYKYTSTLVECVTECPVEGFLPMQFKADSPRGESAIANMLKRDEKWPEVSRRFREDFHKLLEYQRAGVVFGGIASGMFCETIRELNAEMKRTVAQLKYLGPLRSYPPRHLAFDQYKETNLIAGGGQAWDIVRRDEEIRQSVNEWLGNEDRLCTPYELVERTMVSMGDIRDNVVAWFNTGQEGVEDSIDELLNFLNEIVNQGAIESIPDLVLMDKNTKAIVSHRDVGIGISQILPVLVSAYGNREAIVAIEQPEIHLHPALQSELGDVFIESALGERHNTFLLETHSEHLILRILRRIRETTNGELDKGLTPITPDDVSVLYVQPSSEGSNIIELPVTPDGDFTTDWPGGFFEERMTELF